MLLALAALAGLALCVYGAAHDIATLTIPNWVNAAIALLGVSALMVAGLGWQASLWHVGLAGIVFLISFGLFSFGVYGGGDAKMIPAVALWMGPDAMVAFLFWMAACGGALALIGLASRWAPVPASAPGWVLNTLCRGDGVPYGVAIAAGAVIAAPLSPLLSPALTAFAPGGLTLS